MANITDLLLKISILQLDPTKMSAKADPKFSFVTSTVDFLMFARCRRFEGNGSCTNPLGLKRAVYWVNANEHALTRERKQLHCRTRRN